MPSHRVYIGDALMVLRSLAPESIDLALTGPPYWKTVAYPREKGQIGLIEDYAAYINAIKGVWEGIARVLKPGAILCFWVHDLYNRHYYKPLHSDLSSALPPSFALRQIFVWDRYVTRIRERNELKPLNTMLQYVVIAQKCGVNSNQPFLEESFNKLYWRPVWRKKTIPKLLGSKTLYRAAYHLRSTLLPRRSFNFSRSKASSCFFLRDPYIQQQYATQCPPEIARRCLELFSQPNDVVLDPFLGTGTTLREAHYLKRSCIGIEVAEAAVPILRQRFSDMPVSYLTHIRHRQ